MANEEKKKKLIFVKKKGGLMTEKIMIEGREQIKRLLGTDKFRMKPESSSNNGRYVLCFFLNDARIKKFTPANNSHIVLKKDEKFLKIYGDSPVGIVNYLKSL